MHKQHAYGHRAYEHDSPMSWKKTDAGFLQSSFRTRVQFGAKNAYSEHMESTGFFGHVFFLQEKRATKLDLGNSAAHEMKYRVTNTHYIQLDAFRSLIRP